MRAECILSDLRNLDNPGEGFLDTFTEMELVRCAVTIAVAYLNPSKNFSSSLKNNFHS